MWTFIGIVVVLFLGLILFCLYQAGRNKRLKTENKTQKSKIENLSFKRDETIRLHNEQQTIDEEANDEKNELEKTDDSDLVIRANNLFK